MQREGLRMHKHTWHSSFWTRKYICSFMKNIDLPHPFSNINWTVKKMRLLPHRRCSANQVKATLLNKVEVSGVSAYVAVFVTCLLAMRILPHYQPSVTKLIFCGLMSFLSEASWAPVCWKWPSRSGFTCPADASPSWTKPTATGSHLDTLVLIGWAILQAEHQCYISADGWSRTQGQSGGTVVRIHPCIPGSEIPEIISLVSLLTQTKHHINAVWFRETTSTSCGAAIIVQKDRWRWLLRWLLMMVQHDFTAETFWTGAIYSKRGHMWCFLI